MTVTPGERPVIARRRPARRASTSRCSAPTRTARPRSSSRRSRAAALFCDEWEQASKGGELSGPVGAGLRRRASEVTEIGDVLAGARPGRQAAEEITLFDSTGLAIQDLGIAAGVLAAWREGSVEAPTIAL